MRKLACIIGLHKLKFVTWAWYRYQLNFMTNRLLKQAIKKCQCCGKYSKAPEWYYKEFREMYPLVDEFAQNQTWKPEIEEIAEI